MKNRFWKTGILLIGISLLLSNCENDEILENTNGKLEIENSNLKISKISIEQLQQLKNLQNPINLINKNFDVNKSRQEYLSKSSIDANDGSFTILTDEILLVETDSTKTYTFRIKTPTDNKSSFQNFVIDFPNENHYYFYIYKYTFEQNSTKVFPYSMSRVKVDENLVSLSNLNGIAARGTTCGTTITMEVVGTEITCSCCGRNEIHPTCTSGYDERQLFAPVITYQGPCGTTPEATYPESTDATTDNCDTCGANGTGSGSTQGTGDSSSTSAILLSVDYKEFYSTLSFIQKKWCDANYALIENFLIQNNYSMDAYKFASIAIDANFLEKAEVDWEDQIIIDSTILNNQKVNCILKKLKQLNSTLFTKILNETFEGTKEANIKFEIGDIPDDNNFIYEARTYPSYNGNNRYFRIRLKNSFVQNASSIEIAFAIIHETIHAELLERCIQSGLILNITPSGTYTFQNYGNPSISTNLTVFNSITTYYKNLGNGNPQWNHDIFNIFSLRQKLSENLLQIHPWLDDLQNPLINVINSDNIINSLESLFDYLSWGGLEGTQEYMNLSPEDKTKKEYIFQSIRSNYNKNCN